jgi:hypothetical protein
MIDDERAADRDLEIPCRERLEDVVAGRGRRDHEAEIDRTARGAVDVARAIVGDTWNLLPRAEVAEARVRSVVPENAVAATRYQHRHDRVRVVLRKLDIVALDVE